MHSEKSPYNDSYKPRRQAARIFCVISIKKIPNKKQTNSGIYVVFASCFAAS